MFRTCLPRRAAQPALARLLPPSRRRFSPSASMASNADPAAPVDGAKTPQPFEGTTLADLPKSWTFTSKLPNDPVYPTPADSHNTPRHMIRPRQVRGALYTWVRPEGAS